MTYRLIRHRESYIALIYSSAQDLETDAQPSRLDASPLSTLSPPPLHPAWRASRVSGASPARIPGWPLGHPRHSSSRCARVYDQERAVEAVEMRLIANLQQIGELNAEIEAAIQRCYAVVDGERVIPCPAVTKHDKGHQLGR